MNVVVQSCISWILSLFCLLILGNTLRELHAFSNQNPNHHSDMAIRQNCSNMSLHKFKEMQTEGEDDLNMFADFGKFERNRRFLFLFVIYRV